MGFKKKRLRAQSLTYTNQCLSYSIDHGVVFLEHAQVRPQWGPPSLARQGRKVQSN